MDAQIESLLKSNERAVRIFQTAAILGSITTTFVGVIALVGWQLNINIPTTPLHVFIINPLGAVACVCIGLSLFFQIKNIPYTTKSMFFSVSLFCTLLVTLIGAISTLGILGGFETGIDKILFTNRLAGNTLSPDTSITLLLIGLSLLFFQFPLIKYFTRIGQMLTLFASLITMFAVIGYTYQIFTLYKILPFVPMPFSFAIIFTIICLSLLATTAHHGILKVLTKDTPSSKLALRLIIITLTLPAIGGYILLLAQKIHLVTLQTGISLFVIATISLISTIIWLNTRIVQKMELENLFIKNELEKENIKLKIDAEKLATKALDLEGKKEQSYDFLMRENLLNPPKKSGQSLE